MEAVEPNTPVSTSVQTVIDHTNQELQIEKDKLALEQAKFAYERKKGPLANVAVSVTVIAAVAALGFQSLGFLAAREDRKAATERLKTSEQQAGRDFEYKGLELFVTGEDKIVECDPAATEAQVSLFSSLFPNSISRFRTAASAKAQACATTRANAAATTASSVNASPQKIEAAADKARYATISSFAPSSTQAATKASLRTIYLQIADESQRGDALNLQFELTEKGYSCPGIQLVSAAPKLAQLRVYRSDELTAASAVTSIIGPVLHSSPPAAISIERTFKHLPPGVAEFWFPAVA